MSRRQTTRLKDPIHTLGKCEWVSGKGGCIALLVSRGKSPVLQSASPSGIDSTAEPSASYTVVVDL